MRKFALSRFSFNIDAKNGAYTLGNIVITDFILENTFEIIHKSIFKSYSVVVSILIRISSQNKLQ